MREWSTVLSIRMMTMLQVYCVIVEILIKEKVFLHLGHSLSDWHDPAMFSKSKPVSFVIFSLSIAVYYYYIDGFLSRLVDKDK